MYNVTPLNNLPGNGSQRGNNQTFQVILERDKVLDYCFRMRSMEDSDEASVGRMTHGLNLKWIWKPEIVCKFHILFSDKTKIGCGIIKWIIRGPY